MSTTNERAVEVLEKLKADGYNIEDLIELVRHIAAISAYAGTDENETGSDTESGEVILMRRVTAMMHEIGIPAHIKGYQYVRAAIVMAYKNPNVINAVVRELYPDIAEQFDTTPSRVERAVRHAIEVAWDRGNLVTLDKYFGNTIDSLKGKSTNSEFIALLADKLRLEDGK